MADPNRSSAAGGFLIALAVMAGVVVGLFVHQPTIGFLGGLAVGIGAATWVWLADRK